MSVLIKDMGKPKSCYVVIDGKAKHCPFVNTDADDDCILLLEKGIWALTWEEQYANCPLVELPEKHGRLIDAEALIDTLEQAIAIMETMLKQLDLEADDGCLMELKAYRDIRDGIKEIDAVIEAEG